MSIPYTPTAEELENPESIVVWYIDGSGNVFRYQIGLRPGYRNRDVYDSISAIYRKLQAVNFNDVARMRGIQRRYHLLPREITYGTGGGNFSRMRSSRAAFIVMLMSIGIADENRPTTSPTPRQHVLYRHVAAAKRLGISNGVGNNMFAPGRKITGKEMFTLLCNVLNIIQEPA